MAFLHSPDPCHYNFFTFSLGEYLDSHQNFFQVGNTDGWTLENDVTLISRVCPAGIGFLPHFQEASHLLSLPGMEDTGTVSILALSRIQQEEMSSDAFPRENGRPLERCWRGCNSWESDPRNLSGAFFRKWSEKGKREEERRRGALSIDLDIAADMGKKGSSSRPMPLEGLIGGVFGRLSYSLF